MVSNISIMEKVNYKAVLEGAKADLLTKQAELGACLEQQEFIEAQIIGLRQTIIALAKLLGEDFDEEESLGLTDAIRDAFKAKADQNLIAMEVRDVIKSLGYDVSKYGNVMASVHSVIKRLEAKGEIRHVGNRGDGKPAYRWSAPVKPGDLGKRFREASERLTKKD